MRESGKKDETQNKKITIDHKILTKAETRKELQTLKRSTVRKMRFLDGILY